MSARVPAGDASSAGGGAPLKSPLSHCSDGAAVMTSLSTLARLGHVTEGELRRALARSQAGEAGERVDVTRVSDGLVVGELGTSPEARPAQGVALQGRRTCSSVSGAYPPGISPRDAALTPRTMTETTSLLTSVPPSLVPKASVQSLHPGYMGAPLGSVSAASVASCYTTLRSDAGSPLSQVKIKAHSAPRNAVYMIPNARHDTTTVLLLDDEAPPLAKSPLEAFLPSVIKEVREIGVVEEAGEGYSYIIIEYARPVLIWVVLIAAVVGLASKAVVAEAMYPAEVSAIAKSVWMNVISLVFFAALAATELRAAALPAQVRELFYAKSTTMLSVYLLGTEEPPQYLHARAMVPCFGILMILLAALLHGLFSIFFLVSLEYTTLENCVVLMNLHPILVMVPRLNRTKGAERLGAVLVAVGTASLMYTSPARASAQSPVWGNFLAFMVSIFMWVYLSLSQQLQAALPGGLLMTLIVAGSCAVQLLQYSSLANPGDRLVAGMFAHFGPNFLGGFCGGFLAYGGFMVAGRYLNPLVVSVNITLEPIYSVVLQLLYVHIYPPALVWVSLGTLVVGAIICALGGKNERENVVLADHYEEQQMAMMRDVLEETHFMT